MGGAVTVYGVGPADRGQRLDRFLAARIPAVSRAYVQRAIRSRVTLSWGAAPKPSTRVRPGGSVLVGFPALAEGPVSIALPVLARGDGWLAVDKPAGIPVHPVRWTRENTVLRILTRQEQRPGLRLVHRLDRETTGVLLLAEDIEAARFLSGEFAQGRVRKEYIGVVRGVMERDRGEIDLFVEDARSFEPCGGRPALTRWEVVRRLGDRTVVRLFPLTGRRHQIRVHLAAIGHPIAGDLVYGRRGAGDPGVRPDDRSPRHLLHCARMVFRTRAGVEEEVVSPLPPDIQEAGRGAP